MKKRNRILYVLLLATAVALGAFLILPTLEAGDLVGGNEVPY